MRARSPTISVCAISLAGLLASAVRTGATAQEQGQEGSVTGVVVAASQPRSPIRAAVVELTAPGRPSVSRLTDDKGEFAFREIAPGEYGLRVSKGGYLSMEYGSLEIGGQGTRLVIGDGSHLRVSIALMKGAVVAGVIRDTHGEPVADVLVTLASEGRTPQQVWTDHRGRYRFYGLRPGEYTISAQPPSGFQNFMYPSVVATAAQVDAALAALARPSTSLAPSRETPTLAGPAVLGYVPVFYSGTTDPSIAERVRVEEGQEKEGLDFGLLSTGTSRIQGRVVGPPGADLTRVRVLASSGAAGSAYRAYPRAPDGSFEVANLPPGRYVVRAQLLASDVREGPPEVLLWATADVHVSSDVLDVVLELKEPMTLSGRIIFDETPGTPTPAFTDVRVEAGSVPARGGVPVSVATPRQDGSFRLAGLEPGTYVIDVRVRSTRLAEWKLQSAVAGDRDLLDGIELDANTTSLSGAVLRVSARRAELSGILSSAAGSPLSDYYVIAFPTDRASWRPTARRMMSTRPATDGTYRFADLPPGEYLVAVLTTLPSDWRSSPFLTAAVGSAVRVSVREGERATQHLRVAR